MSVGDPNDTRVCTFPSVCYVNYVQGTFPTIRAVERDANGLLWIYITSGPTAFRMSENGKLLPSVSRALEALDVWDDNYSAVHINLAARCMYFTCIPQSGYNGSIWRIPLDDMDPLLSQVTARHSPVLRVYGADDLCSSSDDRALYVIVNLRSLHVYHHDPAAAPGRQFTSAFQSPHRPGGPAYIAMTLSRCDQRLYLLTMCRQLVAFDCAAHTFREFDPSLLRLPSRQISDSRPRTDAVSCITVTETGALVVRGARGFTTIDCSRPTPKARALDVHTHLENVLRDNAVCFEGKLFGKCSTRCGYVHRFDLSSIPGVRYNILAGWIYPRAFHRIIQTLAVLWRSRSAAVHSSPTCRVFAGCELMLVAYILLFVQGAGGYNGCLPLCPPPAKPAAPVVPRQTRAATAAARKLAS